MQKSQKLSKKIKVKSKPNGQEKTSTTFTFTEVAWKLKEDNEGKSSKAKPSAYRSSKRSVSGSTSSNGSYRSKKRCSMNGPRRDPEPRSSETSITRKTNLYDKKSPRFRRKDQKSTESETERIRKISKTSNISKKSSSSNKTNKVAGRFKRTAQRKQSLINLFKGTSYAASDSDNEIVGEENGGAKGVVRDRCWFWPNHREER